MNGAVTIIEQGDALTVLNQFEAGFFNCCVTSPPYWGLRDYGNQNQIGLERSPSHYITKLVEVFSAVRRILRDDGTLWIVIADSYARPAAKGVRGPSPMQNSKCGTPLAMMTDVPTGMKAKDLVGVPWMLAFALRDDGWFLRSDIIWHKTNPMPESVLDRPTKSHEYIFLLSKSEKYFYDGKAVAEPLATAPNAHSRKNKTTPKERGPRESCNTGLQDMALRMRTGDVTTRNKRSVWTVPTQPYKGAHFATFPTALIEPCILAGCPLDGWVLDPFSGAGTTALVSKQLGRNAVGIELNPEYVALSEARIEIEAP